jgi:hypothetical protein
VLTGRRVGPVTEHVHHLACTDLLPPLRLSEQLWCKDSCVLTLAAQSEGGHQPKDKTGHCAVIASY